MIITVFRARPRKDLNPELFPEIEKRTARMLELAATMKGFISYKDFNAADGENAAIVEFETIEDVRAWHDHPEHLAVQQWGRDHVFESYDIKTGEVLHTLRFPK